MNSGSSWALYWLKNNNFFKKIDWNLNLASRRFHSAQNIYLTFTRFNIDGY